MWGRAGVAAAVTLSLVAPSPAASAATPRCDGKRATIVGAPGRDRLRGTPGDDVIFGGRGRDRIFGRGGDDSICGGGGRTTSSGTRRPTR